MDPVIIYQSEDGRTKIDVRLDSQTVWLSQKQLTELYGKAKGTISEHIKHIFDDNELEEMAVVRVFRTTAADGKSYEVAHYNLDMVLALGFRVRSPAAVRFRQWAADKLTEYITKGPRSHGRRSNSVPPRQRPAKQRSRIRASSRTLIARQAVATTMHDHQ